MGSILNAIAKELEDRACKHGYTAVCKPCDEEREHLAREVEQRLGVPSRDIFSPSEFYLLVHEVVMRAPAWKHLREVMIQEYPQHVAVSSNHLGPRLECEIPRRQADGRATERYQIAEALKGVFGLSPEVQAEHDRYLAEKAERERRSRGYSVASPRDQEVLDKITAIAKEFGVDMTVTARNGIRGEPRLLVEYVSLHPLPEMQAQIRALIPARVPVRFYHKNPQIVKPESAETRMAVYCQEYDTRGRAPGSECWIWRRGGALFVSFAQPPQTERWVKAVFEGKGPGWKQAFVIVDKTLLQEVLG